MNLFYIYIVSGEANFVTNLTIGGFTQPEVARSLIELPTNSEKGLSSRFCGSSLTPCMESLQILEKWMKLL